MARFEMLVLIQQNRAIRSGDRLSYVAHNYKSLTYVALVNVLKLGSQVSYTIMKRGGQRLQAMGDVINNTILNLNTRIAEKKTVFLVMVTSSSAWPLTYMVYIILAHNISLVDCIPPNKLLLFLS